MYSNFITPPDFVQDQFHTVTIVNATLEEVELLGRMCKGSDDQYNIYLYKSEMNDLNWLQEAAKLSDAIIINSQISDAKIEDLLLLDKTYYYGDKTFISNANKLDNVFQYFAIRYHEQNK